MVILQGMIGPAICFLFCAVAQQLPVNVAAIIIAIGSAISAVTVGAVSCNHFDISKYNAGIYLRQPIFHGMSLP